MLVLEAWKTRSRGRGEIPLKPHYLAPARACELAVSSGLAREMAHLVKAADKYAIARAAERGDLSLAQWLARDKGWDLLRWFIAHSTPWTVEALNYMVYQGAKRSLVRQAIEENCPCYSMAVFAAATSYQDYIGLYESANIINKKAYPPHDWNSYVKNKPTIDCVMYLDPE